MLRVSEDVDAALSLREIRSKPAWSMCRQDFGIEPVFAERALDLSAVGGVGDDDRFHIQRGHLIGTDDSVPGHRQKSSMFRRIDIDDRGNAPIRVDGSEEAEPFCSCSPHDAPLVADRRETVAPVLDHLRMPFAEGLEDLRAHGGAPYP